MLEVLGQTAFHLYRLYIITILFLFWNPLILSFCMKLVFINITGCMLLIFCLIYFG